MMAGSLVLHGGLVGIASLWTPPPPEEKSVRMDIFDGPPETPGGIRETVVVQPNPPETPEATAKPEDVDPVATPPPMPEEIEVSEPAEVPPPTHRATAAKPAVSAIRPTSSQTGARNPAGPSGIGTPGGGNPAGVTGSWVTPHPPYPHLLGRPAVTGQTTVRITTDAAGRVSNVVIVKSTGNPALDNHTSSYVRNNWHGPPNASRTTEFVYEVR